MQSTVHATLQIRPLLSKTDWLVFEKEKFLTVWRNNWFHCNLKSGLADGPINMPEVYLLMEIYILTIVDENYFWKNERW